MTTISQESHLDIIIQSEKVNCIPCLGKNKTFSISLHLHFFFSRLLISHTPIPITVIGKGDEIPFSLTTAIRNCNPISPNFLKISNELLKTLLKKRKKREGKKKKEKKQLKISEKSSRKLKYSLRVGETFYIR